MAADFPNDVPIFPIYGSMLYPRKEDRNTANREIEAICTELGINPRSISDAVAPGATPASVAAYLDMLANIVKVQSGAANWYSASARAKRFIGGSGGGGVVAAGATEYVGFFQRLLSATENLTHTVVSYHAHITLLRIHLFALATIQPVTGTMVFTLRVNGVNTSMTVTVPVGAGAPTTYLDSNAVSVDVFPGDFLSLKVVNNALANSADIDTFTVVMEQVG